MKRLHLWSIIQLIFISLVSAVSFYWMVLEPDVLMVKNPEAISVDKTSYNKGDTITYTLEYCKTKSAVVTIYRSLSDSYRINYEPVVTRTPAGCATIKIADMVIPTFIEGDGHVYYIVAELEVQANPLKTQTLSWRSVSFTVN